MQAEPARWITSSHSYANGAQAARLPDGQVGVRDSKNPGANDL
jgi:Domain of unknown function (DUF397)